MSRQRKLALAVCVASAVIAVVVWVQPTQPAYKGRTVEQWFRRHVELRDNVSHPPRRVELDELALVESAFLALGTNAVPYLAGRMTRDQNYSRLDMLRIKNRQRFPRLLEGVWPLPQSKSSEGSAAASLLYQIRPPGEMLLPLIEPALQSTNSNQRVQAFIALRGISSGHELMQTHVLRGLNDSHSEVQYWAAEAVGGFGPHGKWAVSNLLELANSPDLRVHEGAVTALNSLGTNASSAVPRLREMLAGETNAQRRKIIANSIDYLSND